ncbi:MAG: glutamine synthetase [Desulfobacterales bacterium]|nr:MAG: glutamine synthetase [Desulfobacterales bacterium]
MKTAHDILREVKEAQIELIRFVYTDNDGVIRSYAATAEALEGDLETGHNFAIAMPFFSVLDDLVPGTRFGCTGELAAVPDPATFRILPHVPRTAMVLCDFRQKTDHAPCGLCARSLLKEYLAGLEYEVYAAFENEFYLITRDEDGCYTPWDRSLCFATTGMNQHYPVIADMVRNLRAQGLRVEKYYPEYGRGQVEIVYACDHALQAADNQVYFRETVRGVAQQHGLIASFMPKPFQELAGSGAHLHLSLFKDGRNLLFDRADPYGLSRTGKYFLGGLLKHLKAICAFTASTVNSYKRLVPHHWASAYACWGPDNREAALRVVSGMKGREEASFNIEIKPVDAACNPYLAVLATLAAGISGIENQIEPGLPVLTDPYELTDEKRQKRGITRLPKTLGEAILALAADEFYRKLLGEVFWDEYIMLKRYAWIRYIEHISDWEIRTYLETF